MDPATGRRLPLPVSVFVPVVLLVMVVALGAAGRLTTRERETAHDARSEPVAQEAPRSRASPQPLPPPAFATEVAGLPVLSVGDALEQVRSQPHGTLIAVGGWLTAPKESTVCEAPPGRPEPSWTLLCWRGAVLSGDDDPLLAADGTPLRLGDPGPQLTGEVMPGTALAASARDDDAGRRVLRPRPVILLGRALDRRQFLCDAGRSCARSFAIERILTSGGAVDDRVTRRDPALPLSTLPRANLLAAVASAVPGSPVVLREVFLDVSDLVYLEPSAAVARVPPAGNGIWFVTVMAHRGEPAGGVNWLVVDDATGHVLASGPA